MNLLIQDARFFLKRIKRYSARQRIVCVYGNLQFSTVSEKSPSLNNIFSKLNPLHTLHHISLRSTLILSLSLPSCLIFLDSLTNVLHEFFTSPYLYPASLILLHLITLIILVEEEKSRSFSLCNFLRLSLIPTFLCPNIFL